MPRPGFWPAVLTLNASQTRTIEGKLYQENGDNKASFCSFLMRGTQTGAVLRLDHVKVLNEASPTGGFWCQGSITLTYDAAEEKLTGRATYRPEGDCNTGLFSFYRIRLKSAATVAVNAQTTLRVSGRDVRWFADSAGQQPLGTGNSLPMRLPKTTTFYLSQGFYDIGRSRLVPITVRTKPAPVAAKAPTPVVRKPAAPPAPVVLPTVLFRTTTAELLPESGPALDKLAATLRARPTLHLRVAGHTDRIGEPAKNQVLSEQRARAVKTYLVQAGIAASRLETVGYGDTRPRYPVPDARNRRVEVEEVK